MNPMVAEYWKKALKNFKDAKVDYKNGNSDTDIKKNLWMSICNGQLMVKMLNQHGEESLISAGIAVENLGQLEQLGIRQAFAKTLQALVGYRNLVSSECNLPLPIGLDKYNNQYRSVRAI